MVTSPRTPVLVGIGQYSERIGEPGYEALPPVGIAERATDLALADAGVDPAEVELLACTRQFDESFPGMWATLGRPDNFPRAVARRVGVREDARCVYTITGGQSPQQTITSLASAIAAGELDVAVVTAAEAISTVLHLAGLPDRPDLSEVTGVRDEDRGVALEGILASTQVAHQLTDAPTQYALFENARRGRLGMTRAEQTEDIGRWFAPFTEVAAANPHAAVRTVQTGAELTTPTESNRMIADPYPKAVVAREKVNQSASVVIVSTAVADRLGIADEQRVYLRGHSDLRDRELTRRPDLSRSVPAVTAVNAALEMAGIGVDDLTALDLYSCFPIAVSIVAEELGLSPEDPRRLTVTGGLPFFGGPGNGYSLHPIVEVVGTCRRDSAAWGLVGANGGMLTKYSVGIYSRTPGEWEAGDDRSLQAAIDAVPDVPVTLYPDGWATVETWTVKFEGGAPRAVVVGRTEAGERFVANDLDADDEVCALLLGEHGPGARVFVRSLPVGNRVALTRERMDELAPVPPTGLAPSYEYLEVDAAGGVLEVRITGTDEQQVLPSAAHFELAAVFDAFEADPSLRVAILTGEGGLWADPVGLPAFGIGQVVPPTGLAGLTGRRFSKPVIAALAGDALGTACEVVLGCHLVVAEEGSRLGLPQVRAALIPAAGGLARLAQQLPPAVANRMALTGLPVTATEAERWGLVTRVVPRGDVVHAARLLAAEVLASAPLAVARSLELMSRASAGEDTARAAADVLDSLLVTSDAAEAFHAQNEGRTPHWRGN